MLQQTQLDIYEWEAWVLCMETEAKAIELQNQKMELELRKLKWKLS